MCSKYINILSYEGPYFLSKELYLENEGTTKNKDFHVILSSNNDPNER
jgi:hypothetical protein